MKFAPQTGQAAVGLGNCELPMFDRKKRTSIERLMNIYVYTNRYWQYLHVFFSPRLNCPYVVVQFFEHPEFGVYSTDQDEPATTYFMRPTTFESSQFLGKTTCTSAANINNM